MALKPTFHRSNPILGRFFHFLARISLTTSETERILTSESECIRNLTSYHTTFKKISETLGTGGE